MNEIKCPNCGKEVAAKMSFCGACGTKIEYANEIVRAPVSAVQKSARGSFNPRKYVKPALVSAILIFAVIAAVNIFQPAKYEKVKSAIFITQGGSDVIIQPVGKGKTSIDGFLINQLRTVTAQKLSRL